MLEYGRQIIHMKKLQKVNSIFYSIKFRFQPEYIYIYNKNNKTLVQAEAHFMLRC